MRRTLIGAVVTAAFVAPLLVRAQPQQRYTRSDGALRVALAQQPFGPNGTSPGPRTMANGGIQKALADLGATVQEALHRAAPSSPHVVMGGAIKGVKAREK